MERFDQYVLLKRVGAGGMAELFKAKKVGIEGFERVVAIKRILPHLSSDDEFIDMFIAEAKLAARLSQRNIVQIYDFGKIGESYFIAMEYVPGKDLRSILRRCKAKNINFPLALAIYVTKEVASGLHTAHNQKDNNGNSLNIIHRDVSPQNILISYDGEVKVVDFGIAKATTHSKTSTGVLKGKVSYMSPEQAWGKSIDHRSDIFSLGICLYEMLTGEKLFKGEGELNTLEKVREANIERLPSLLNSDVSPVVEALALKTLAKDASQRYQTARDLETDLNGMLFQLSRNDPATQLRQFMHDLFPTEIEEEQWEDVDQTVYVEDDQDYVPKSKGSRPTGSKQIEDRRTGSGQIESKQIEDRRPESGQIEDRRTGSGQIEDRRTGSGQIEKKAEPLGTLEHSGAPGRKKITYVAAAAVVALVLAFGGFYFFRSPAPRTEQRAAAQGVEQRAAAQGVEQRAAAQALPQQPQPEVAPQAGIERGTLSIDAKPWANVYIEEKEYGRTPQTIKDLEVGTHRVKLENPDFEPWETTVKVPKKGVAKVHHDFVGFSKIMVNAKPWGNVFLDGNPKGQTPITLDKVPAGQHVIRIAREGYAEISRTITVKPSEEKSLSVPLQKVGN